MGYSWYLRRPDNRTLFELGKWTGGWCDLLGGGTPIVLGPDHEDTLAGMLADVAKAIVTWADGQSFIFEGEDSVLDDKYDHGWTVTGTRYRKPTR